MTLFYKNPEDVVASEEDPTIVNVNEVCQHCGNESGYSLIGKVGEAEPETEEAPAVEEDELDLNLDSEGAPEEGTEEAPVDDLNFDDELEELDLDIEEDPAEEEEEKKEESFVAHTGEALVEELADDKELDAKLEAHSEYIEYLRNMIAQEEAAFEKTENAQVKDAIQRRIDAFKADLENALPDAVKNDEAIEEPVEEAEAPEAEAEVDNAEPEVQEEALATDTENTLTEALHEAADTEDVSDAEFEQLMNSSEFKKPISDTAVRAMLAMEAEENSKKESPLDFALWKKTEEGVKFESPWSNGRPGWHSECVVMINSLIEDGHIDIHGGGFDLKFPHHENEIAQQVAIKGHKIANYWMHNGFINVDNVKMSKSLGNVILANDYINLYGGNVVRFLLVNTHYRVPVNFSSDLVDVAKKELERIQSTYNKLAVHMQIKDVSFDDVDNEKLDIEKFVDALKDDLNTANAMTELYRVIKQGNVLLRNREIDNEQVRINFLTLKKMFYLLGFNFEYPVLSQEDKDLYNQYLESKANKDFATSDKLRTILIEKHIL
jgi:cysteinyl-tRNA synthetase